MITETKIVLRIWHVSALVYQHTYWISARIPHITSTVYSTEHHRICLCRADRIRNAYLMNFNNWLRPVFVVDNNDEVDASQEWMNGKSHNKNVSYFRLNKNINSGSENDL